jgi:peptidoglycan/LPS O-acetylase OafA/YrhL
MPGLDGLRALAVSAVVAYHLGFGWASGGLLGVAVFFTLSGYLITDLLLAQFSSGKLRLADFWLARARRLLPALFLMLIVVTVWVWIADQSQLDVVRNQVGAAAVYMSNWWQSFQHISYFARFGPPSPLNHLWSLSVEEQFYVLWPWLLLLGVHLVKERRRPIRIRPRLAGLTLILAVISAIEMSVLFAPSIDPSRVYYGTDTRAFGLLIGAALAMVWPSRSLTTKVGAHARGIMDGLGVLGLVVIGLLVWRTNQYSTSLYHGDLVLLSVATALAVAALAHPAARLGRVLGWGPMRWVGVRSYGIYLWHAPIIILTTPAINRGVNPIRATLQVAATVAIAALSWRYVEEPIRRGALGRLWARARAAQWRPRALPRATAAILAGAGLILVLAAVGLAGIRPPSFSGGAGAEAVAATSLPRNPAPVATAQAVTARPHTPKPSTTSRTATTPSTTSTTTTSTTAASTTTAPATRPPHHRRAREPQTSCRAVVHIGDSTSEGMISSDYLPDPAQRLGPQYARVGVRSEHLEIAGATSIVETLPGGVDAYRVARGLVGGGYRGCWVIALGTNDSADVYVGSSIPLSQRIKRMMKVIGSQPVMWVNAKTLVSTGPYSESQIKHWNAALQQACRRYRNMHIYDWASVAKDKWFIPDGIHYYSPGYAARAHLIANALAKAFPASAAARPASCVVHTRSLSIPVLGVKH